MRGHQYGRFRLKARCSSSANGTESTVDPPAFDCVCLTMSYSSLEGMIISIWLRTRLLKRLMLQYFSVAQVILILGQTGTKQSSVSTKQTYLIMTPFLRMSDDPSKSIIVSINGNTGTRIRLKTQKRVYLSEQVHRSGINAEAEGRLKDAQKQSVVYDWQFKFNCSNNCRSE